MAVNRRIRLVDALRRRAGGAISSMTRADIEKAQHQRQHLGRNRVTDLVFGAQAAGVDVEDTSVPARSGELGIRRYTPTGRTPRGTVVNFHGGGWVLGDLDGTDWTCSTVAARTGAQVISVDYRLAPQHPFPAAVEDCLDATLWAAGLDSSTAGLVVMGDSAGGNLAAVTALRCRDDGPVLAHQILIYPGTDMTLGSPSLQAHADAEFLTLDDVYAFRALYLGADLDELVRDPRASPLLHPDLTGVAPALIITAEFDPIRDDGSRYAEALRSAGVAVRLTDYADATHAFMAVPGLAPAARQAIHEICGQLTEAFSGAR